MVASESENEGRLDTSVVAASDSSSFPEGTCRLVVEVDDSWAPVSRHHLFPSLLPALDVSPAVIDVEGPLTGAALRSSLEAVGDINFLSQFEQLHCDL